MIAFDIIFLKWYQKLKEEEGQRKGQSRRNKRNLNPKKELNEEKIAKRRIQLFLTKDDTQEVAPGARIYKDLLDLNKTSDLIFEGLMIQRRNKKN